MIIMILFLWTFRSAWNYTNQIKSKEKFIINRSFALFKVSFDRIQKDNSLLSHDFLKQFLVVCFRGITVLDLSVIASIDR